jgi:hypothetical protein
LGALVLLKTAPLIERHDRYWIVEKTGHAQDMARSADPRSKAAPLSLHT